MSKFLRWNLLSARLRHRYLELRHRLGTLRSANNLRPVPANIARLPHENYYIKPEYTARADLAPYRHREMPAFAESPDVYAFTAFLARQFRCTHIIDIGCGNARKLAALYPEFQIIGIDLPQAVEFCHQQYPFGKWIADDLEKPGFLALDRAIVKRSIIICSNVIEYLQAPEHLIENLHRLLNAAPVALVSTPERDLVRGNDDNGPPPDLDHSREWNLQEFEKLFLHCGFNVEFIGLTTDNSAKPLKRTILAVLANHHRPERKPAPSSFEVVAIVKAFNEADIIGPALSHLIGNGIKVYLIDNWSTDATVEIARSFLGKGLIHIEQFPLEGRNNHRWIPLLERTEEIALSLNANWYIHQDIDEYRESPWPDLNLRDGLYHADQCGYNAADSTLLNFEIVDDSFISGTDFVDYFRYWDFGHRPGHFQRINVWKNTGQRVKLAQSGGHMVGFPGRRVYPFKFLSRHYTFRTQEQAYRKINKERISHPSEEATMHKHYALFKEVETFLRNPQDLYVFDDNFYSQFLVERLSGVNITRDRAV